MKQVFAGCFLFFLTAAAQAQNKLPLDHSAYEIWNFIEEEAISNDGSWILASMGPEDGDAKLQFKHIADDQSHQIARGYDARFTDDSRFGVFLIAPPRDSLRQAKRDEKKGDALPKDTLGLIDLATGTLFKHERVQSYKLPKKAPGYLAYLLEKPVAPEDSTESKTSDDDDEKSVGSPLVLRNLNTGSETRFEDALTYHFTEDGNRLIYTVSSPDSTADGIYSVETSSGSVTPIMTGKGSYKQVALDEAGTQAAFLSDREDQQSDPPSFALYHWDLHTETLETLAREGSPGIPDGWWIGEHGSVSFSKSGYRLYFGTAPRPEKEEEDPRHEDEKVKVEVWSWEDPLLQPMQKLQVEDEKKRTYTAVVHMDGKKIVQLGDIDVPEVTVGRHGDADVAVANTNRPYRQEISWESPMFYDVYLIDIETGSRRMVLEKLQAQAKLSPEAGYISWWNRDERAWYAMSTTGNAPINLTTSIPHPVYDEDHDRPEKPDSYGNAGWTTDDRSFLVYDRFDIWDTDPAGRRATRSFTEGRGRETGIRFRHIDLDPEADAIDPTQPILLSAFHLKTKAEGFFRDQFQGSAEPQQLVFEDRSFSNPQKAKRADRLLYTRSSYLEFPDLWVAGMDFSDGRKMTDANPQQAEYLWGSAELVEWTSLDGIPLQGILYKPEDFDPSQKYPMMVYFYERNSDTFHTHYAPAPHRSVINRTFYASRGYLVFVPDIPYKEGYPGESALNAVMPGVLHLIDQGFVDEANIGVQGHSWGGYQIAYMVTRTNLFKAAEAGAPVSNMFSAYGGIRWGSGMSRMFQYERTQSRIGGSIWEYPLRFLENSPLFWADKIETPLLIMHNDHDGAVPWYQGIELFVALRRLNKPAWLVNYNDEPHWPTTYPNKVDWNIRMQQYFDHYLKGAPAPTWMTEGIPAIESGKTLGYEPASLE